MKTIQRLLNAVIACTALFLTSCVTQKGATVTVTGNSGPVNMTINNNQSAQIANDRGVIGTPSIHTLARQSSRMGSGSRAPQCVRERPCSREHYVRWYPQYTPPRVYPCPAPVQMSQLVYQESGHRFGYQQTSIQRSVCPPGTRQVSTPGHGVRVVMHPDGRKAYLELGPNGQPTGRPGRPPGANTRRIGGGAYDGAPMETPVYREEILRSGSGSTRVMATSGFGFSP